MQSENKKPAYRYELVIKGDKCKGCELCVSFCPKDVLEMDKVNTNSKGYHPVVAARIEDCIGCSSCGIMCPDGVINIYKEEL